VPAGAVVEPGTDAVAVPGVVVDGVAVDAGVVSDAPA
jgi:hypothetical protein